MGVSYSYKPPRCRCRKAAKARAAASAHGKKVGNSNYSNKRKARYTNTQNNVNLLNAATPVSILNIGGNSIPILPINVPIAILGTATGRQVSRAGNAKIVQPACAKVNQSNDD